MSEALNLVSLRELATRLIPYPSDTELKDAFLGATSNTPGPDGINLKVSYGTSGTCSSQRPRHLAQHCIVLTASPGTLKQTTMVALSKPGCNPRRYRA